MAAKQRAPLTFNTNKATAPTPAAVIAKPKTETAPQETAQTSPAKTATAPKRNKRKEDDLKFVGGYISPDAKKQFQILRIQQDSTEQELIVEALNDLFAKYKLTRMA